MGVNNRFREWSRGVIKNPAVSRSITDTVGSDPAVSLVSLTLRDQIPQFQWHCWFCFRCLIEATESFTKMSKSDPALSLTPRDLIPRYHWHSGIWSRGIIDTAESDPEVSLPPRDPIPRWHWYRGIRTFQMIILIFSTNTKPYAKRLQHMNLGPRGDCLMKKTTFPLKSPCFSSFIFNFVLCKNVCLALLQTPQHCCRSTFYSKYLTQRLRLLALQPNTQILQYGTG
jgi:hypothetical protein